MRRALTAAIVAAIAVVAGLGASFLGVLDRPEGDTVDLRFALRGDHRPADVVVVGIDDVTFGALGQRWPFPRVLHARAIDRLREAGARVIVYDVQFTEPSRDERQDVALYDAVARAGDVVLATSEIGPGGSTNVLGGDDNLRAAGARAAAAYLPKDGRGVIRTFTRELSGLGTMPVVAAEVVRGAPNDPGEVPPEGTLIDYRGGPGTIRTVSFSDLLDRRVDPGVFRDAVVVVGATAPSLQDVHLTPADADNPMPGPEVQANAIWTMLHGDLRRAPGWLGLLTIVGMGIVVPLAALRIRFLAVAVGAAALAAAAAAGAVLAFMAGVVVPVVVPLATLAVATLATGIVSYLRESHERRRQAWLAEVLEGKVHERTQQLRATQLEVVSRLSQASDWRDHETGQHIERMSRIAEALGRARGMTAREAEELRHAAVLHDIGKIGVPDRVLLKAGRLTDEEREVMQGHTTIGGRILAGSDSPLVRMGQAIALTHHERWDGTGYPAGLAGEQIPLEGRICAIADVFDALVSPRRYKEGWPLDDALAELADQRGRQFDAALVDAFLVIAPGLYDELGYAADLVEEPEGVPAVLVG
ncbi:MAG TPA: CHASE2 domain-containing protein [Miltoncostaeaceae bacterium]|nr:CHASE2 domain-containing protein [Miltoncostaeaceae bacterium]